MQIAAHLGDDAFLEYASQQIEEKTEEDDLTKVFEPKGIVLSEIIPIYEIASNTGHKHISFTTLRAVIKDRGYDFSEKEIVSYAKALGFTVVYPHNKAHLKVEGLQRLHDIYERAGFKQNNSEEIDTILKATRVSSYANQVSLG